MNFSLAFWLVVGSLFGAPAVAILFAFFAVRHIPNNCVGIVEKLWSPSGSLDEGQLHRDRRQSRLSGRAAARWRARRLLALAVSRPQAAARHDQTGLHRLRLRARRPAARIGPDARTGCRLQ